MKTRCPCCGAENSLDALVAHEDARAAVWAAAQVGGEVSKLAVQYIALFRPAKTALTFERMAKLLGELLARRNAGSLKLPLKSHGYLYEVISGWQGQGLQTLPAAPEQRQPENSQTLNAAMTLQGMRR